jgi:hypothetical protein
MARTMGCELHQHWDPDYDRFFGDRVIVNNALGISIRRTIRVPGNQQISRLPPDLGPFPLEEVSKYSDNMPADMAAKGGLFFPMYRE